MSEPFAGLPETLPDPKGSQVAEPGRSHSSLLEKALAVATVLMPFAVVLVGNCYSSAIARRDSNVRLTELAAGILRSPATIEARSLRAWAVEVINRYSEVPIPKETGAALRDSISLPWSPFL